MESHQQQHHHHSWQCPFAGNELRSGYSPAVLPPRRRRRLGIAQALLPLLSLLLALRRLVTRTSTDSDAFVPAYHSIRVPLQQENLRYKSSLRQAGRKERTARKLAGSNPQDTRRSSRSIRYWLDLPVYGLGLAIICITFFVVPAETWAATAAAVPDFTAVLAKASASALKGGVAGFFAGQAQVLVFMWMRTTMNYQYAKGGNFMSAIKSLWEDGGIPRLYKGLWLAIVQAPLSRFGDTAANAGMLVLMDFWFPDLPLALKTAAGSTMAALWRVFLMPLDSLKTNLQVNGSEGFEVLKNRVQERGPGELYAGALANFAASWAGNYPYFAVFNGLSEAWVAPDDSTGRIIRNGIMGICASTASDITSNSLRVLKTVRQSVRSADDGGYMEAAQRIIKSDGLLGFLGRGLETRILVNILQGSFFAILWKLIEEQLNFS
mmetsp:Transcript_52192/g.124403  ORF Transcript_52192/g.124403 Transcript_52192/m.124403 type:complete len:436 (+) Transcript_52192:156-1463(+)|eukprot:CAMPEP_0178431916 /NCGR_PEP_ID=MMETSP0689_2-20121128/32109_1 /TAXON_ID=160604 /ORGANISM="Amphidinium massartii, Strain CS-259" /LENGTH=435 /DNA_ID=CAMNT_0020053873 /DNA_START=90 /DNA_END=1397 /DNA_ORIENTATION=-